MQNWHVTIVKQNQDSLAARGLREQGYDVFLPKTYRRENVGRAGKPVASLRLSPYLFVAFDFARGEGGTVKNTRGVSELLCAPDGKPRAISHGPEIIAWFRNMEDEEFAESGRVYAKGRTDLSPGMTVRIDAKGPFQGLLMVVAQIGNGKAKLFDPGNGLRLEIPDTDLTEIKGK